MRDLLLGALFGTIGSAAVTWFFTVQTTRDLRREREKLSQQISILASYIEKTNLRMNWTDARLERNDSGEITTVVIPVHHTATVQAKAKATASRTIVQNFTATASTEASTERTLQPAPETNSESQE